MSLNRPPVLPPEGSAELLERLLGELACQEDSDGLLVWAKISLPHKNTLVEGDARVLEVAYQKRFEEAPLPDIPLANQHVVPAAGWSQPDEHPSKRSGDLHAPASPGASEQVGKRTASATEQGSSFLHSQPGLSGLSEDTC
ncbi:hypothetical protein ABH989_002991 [Bradyrhizobium ottawaense]|nr:hypothetical protein BwSH14_37670 [Bradyrhizobium ottawaense]GMO86596.1 hypothetical protein BwSH17_69860 [Bradyrhizobium ottawaense]